MERPSCLRLGFLGLRHVPAEVFTLTNLRELNLSGNELAELPAEIGQLQQLDTLTVMGNRLQRLPPEIGELRQLRILLAGDNPLLSELPAEIGNLQNLRNLHLEITAISSVPDTISHLQALEVLEINSALLRVLPESIGHLPELRELRLSGNRIERLPESIGMLPKLTFLSLDFNPLLAELPDSVIRMASRCNVGAAGCPLPPAQQQALAAADAARRPAVPATPQLQAPPQTANENVPGPVWRSSRSNPPLIAQPASVLFNRHSSQETRLVLDPLEWRPQPLVVPQRPIVAAQPDEPLIAMTSDERDAFSLDENGERLRDADSFFDWANKMRGTQDYRTAPERVKESMDRLVDDMWKDVSLRKTCFALAFDAERSCEDGAALAFNQMCGAAESSRRLRFGVTEKSVIKDGKREFVRGLVTEAANRKVMQLTTRSRMGEDVETVLRFQTAIQERLEAQGISVGYATRGMRFAGVSGVQESELQACAQEIATKYNDGRSLREFVLAWPVLRSFVDETYQGEFAALKNKFDERVGNLVDDEDNGKITKGQYVASLQQAKRESDVKDQELRDELVATIVERQLSPVTIGDSKSSVTTS